jgi:ribose transport system ATP-binding protein
VSYNNGNHRTAPRLAVSAISKSFGPVRVLDGVVLEVGAGEIHALVGHNGSGKSTLVKIIGGLYRPEPDGVIAIDGEPLPVPTRVKDLIERGVGIVHQDLGLVDALSVTENCRIGRYAPAPFTRRIDWEFEHDRTREVLRRLDSDIDPRLHVGLLSAAGRTTVAIARAIQDQQPGRGVIILDEATRALPRYAQQHLYGLIKTVTVAGGAVLMITHHVGEVLGLADRVTVLRDGRVAAGGLRTADLDEAALGQLLVGRRPAEEAPTHEAATTRTLKDPRWRARIDDLRGARLRGVSFEVSAGEVLGVTGLLDSGVEELPGLMTGTSRATAGSLTVDAGTIDLSKSALRHCLDAGVVLIPERRDTAGLVLSMSVRDNLSLPLLRRNNKPWRTHGAWEEQLVRDSVERFDIRLASSEQPVGLLSGGNRQKVLLSKWLATGPKLLVLHEPTQGVDVGARSQLMAQIRQAASSGVAVVIASIEAEELAAACDRILILRDGLIDAALAGPCDEGQIVHRIYSFEDQEARR